MCLLFFKNKKMKNKCGWSMENWHSTKVRLWFRHISWVHILARFEEDLLNMSVIYQTGFEGMAICTKVINHLDKKDTLPRGKHYTNGCKGFDGKLKKIGKILVKLLLVKVTVTQIPLMTLTSIWQGHMDNSEHPNSAHSHIRWATTELQHFFCLSTLYISTLLARPQHPPKVKCIPVSA